nr:hypothetical protein [Sphingomonas vulcanisoli]
MTAKKKTLTQPSPAKSGRGLYVALAAFALCLLSLALRWPGVVMYDSVGQYEQALTSDYSDWHPPIMAHLWALLLPVWSGTAPFLLLQMLLWWGGFGLIAAVFARASPQSVHAELVEAPSFFSAPAKKNDPSTSSGQTVVTKRQRTYAAIVTLLIGAFPLFLGWGTVVLKDAQMAACLIGATGLVAWWRLDGRKLPVWAIVAVAVLIAYATLVRGNAVFATVPFALALSGWGGVRRWWLRVGLTAAGIVAVLGVSPLINQRLMSAEATHNSRSLPLWDIVAIAHRSGTVPPGVAPADWAAAEQRGCYTPYFWNPYGEPAQCDAIGQALAFSDGPHPQLMRDWAMSVLLHPIAYAAHRLAHFNATTRFVVGWGEPDCLPPLYSEPNSDGLGGPANPGGKALIALAGAASGTPLGWPIVWLAAGLALAWVLRGEASAEAGLARALVLSGVVMSGSFAVASIASDLRYHLWSMIAIALALTIGAAQVPRGRRRIVIGIVLAVALVAWVARFVAPPVSVPLPPRVPGIAAQ